MSTLATLDETLPLRNDGHWSSTSEIGNNTTKRSAHNGSIKDNSELGNGNESIEEIMTTHKGSIGMLGSIAIMVNSLTGPAMLNLPATFQKSGLIPTTMTIVLLCILSSLCSSHTANVISKVPGNFSFRKEIEYSEVFRRTWGQRAFIFTQIAFFCCVTCLNVASIVDTAQIVDQLISRTALQGSAAFRYDMNATSSSHGLAPIWWSRQVCVDEQKQESGISSCIPFEEDSHHVYLLSAGYMVSCLLLLPLSLKDLKENAWFQIVGFVVLIVLSLQFIISFLLHGVSLSNVTLWGHDWSDLFGVTLFNFAVVIAIPAWLYEKKETVNVNSAIHSSSILGFILYVLLGGLGALTMPNVSENMLQTMVAGEFGVTTRICSELFVFFIIGLGIPLFSVLSRLNLTGSGLCSEFVANLLAVYFPWGIAWVFYSGGATSLLGWGGIFFSSIIVFIAPLLLAIHTVIEFDAEGSVAVYGGLFESKRAQLTALCVLLFFSVASIVLACFGKLYQ